ncbi:hypothetical protein SPSIL_013880 [Sporomusa silvacetica DSM 10669]|uniref:Uncharacterized protein n=1 Tax=Sporomusa silvacetica DSM 10669 TaxID=1123289 RepID=A0ABZ3IIM3_9FIRM|nr:hypothetical protein SPSIL_00820 [Sporomusa silvacetica DSM 10669]
MGKKKTSTSSGIRVLSGAPMKSSFPGICLEGFFCQEGNIVKSDNIDYDYKSRYPYWILAFMLVKTCLCAYYSKWYYNTDIKNIGGDYNEQTKFKNRKYPCNFDWTFRDVPCAKQRVHHIAGGYLFDDNLSSFKIA